jgi:hypothetical protein
MAAWTARQVWKELDAARREELARSLWDDERLDRAERLSVLEKWLSLKGTRVAKFENLPRDERVAMIAGGGVTEELARQMLTSFHLAHRRELLGAFLDGLDIAHDEGLIEEEFDPPSRDRVEKALGALRERFDEADVDLYLKTLVVSDDETWAAVGETLPAP